MTPGSAGDWRPVCGRCCHRPLNAIVKSAVFFIFFLASITGQTQHFLSDSLIDRIHHLQSKGNGFYGAGLFPSKRYKKSGKEKVEDNNIFFSALMVYTMQSAYPSFSDEGKRMIDTMIVRVKNNYHRYRNRNGDITYNFWQTHPDRPFPNSKSSNKERYKLPDDLDVTSLIYLTQQNKSKRNDSLKEKMGQHTNLYQKKIHSTNKRYRQFKAYNTWFGKNMKLEFDICVVSNVLLFVYEKKLPLNQYDQDTEFLILEVIRNNDHMNHPYIVSPSYQNSAVILYHLARLLDAAPEGHFDTIRSKIVSDLKSLLATSKNRMEQIILLSSLYRLRESFEFKIDLKGIEYDMETFAFFKANVLSNQRLWLRKVFGKMGVFNFNFQSEAYYQVLILEYMELMNRNN